MTHKPLLLIDGSSYFYRAFHALPPLVNSKGDPTGAVYGVLNMIRRLLNDYQPTHMAVVFDAKGKTFRDELYSEYKANRPPMPDELRQQFTPLVTLIKAMGLPLLTIEGVEADDVIGTLAKQANENDYPVIISTGDKDMAQLVNPHTTLINTMNNATLDEAGVQQKFGVAPTQIIDYLTLIGDKTDNIPGVPGVGPKTAAKWLQHHQTLDHLVANAGSIKGKVGERLRECLDQFSLTRQLVTIDQAVPLDCALTDLTLQSPDNEQLINHFQQLEFKSWLNELLSTQTNTPPATQYITILTQADLDHWLQQLANAPQFAIDTETTSLDPMRAELVGISIAITENEAAYIPVAHDYPDAPVQLNRETVLAQLTPLLIDPSIKKIGQNIKYDFTVFANYAIEMQGITYDTMLESYVLNSAGNRHDMDTLALKYLGKQTTHYEDVAGKGKKQLLFNQIDLAHAAPYAAEDADITLQLHHKLWPQLKEHSGLSYVFEHIEMPLVTVLARMERYGVLIDSESLKTQSIALAQRIAELEQQVHTLAGEEFNLSSPKQLQTILFDQLKLPVLQKTPTGQPSTAESVLHDLAYDYPLPKLIMEYRTLTKLKSTYLDALPTYINPQTGRIHTSYNQAVASTGRLSSTAPNLQNIPVRTPEGRHIRSTFIAPEGYKIIAADYSQIELRIIAHLSQDANLQKAFANGWDVHRATAAEVFGVSLDQVSSEQRRRAKAINFGLIYGMSAFGLAKQLDVSRETAQAYMDRYFQRYPGVQDYMTRARERAHALGYVETIFGRRLYLPEIRAQNMQRRRAAERAAINAPMQGSAADIIKIAMIRIDHWLQQAQIPAKMIMQVHDELVFEVATDYVDTVAAKIHDYMEHSTDLAVPITAAVGTGDNWEEAH